MMTDKISQLRSRYPEIDELYSSIEEHSLKFEILPENRELEKACFRKILMKTPHHSFTVPADDEYEDARLGNPALLFQLVIYAIEEFEDCEDFLVWSTAYGLDTANPAHLDWYRNLGKVTPKIRDIIGYEISGITDFDWQLNAGAAQELRSMLKPV